MCPSTVARSITCAECCVPATQPPAASTLHAHALPTKVCPIYTAHDLHKAWPEAELKIIPDAGHSAYEPGIQTALLEATDRYRST